MRSILGRRAGSRCGVATIVPWPTTTSPAYEARDLAGRGAPDRLAELDLDALVAPAARGRPPGDRGAGARASARARRRPALRGGAASRRATATVLVSERLARADGDRVGARVGGEHVQRLGSPRQAEAVALTDGEGVRAAMGCRARVPSASTIAPGARRSAAVALEERAAGRCRPGSTGPASRACAPPPAPRAPRSRAPRPCAGPRAESAAARARRERARRARSSGPCACRAAIRSRGPGPLTTRA